MTMGPSQEYAREQLQLAEETLDDARYLLQDHRSKAAANRAYYAMFHAVHVALSSVRIRLPKTHSGAINLFGRHFIKTGQMERVFAKYLQEAYDLRQQSDYTTGFLIDEREVKKVLENAEAFVLEIRRMLGIP